MDLPFTPPHQQLAYMYRIKYLKTSTPQKYLEHVLKAREASLILRKPYNFFRWHKMLLLVFWGRSESDIFRPLRAGEPVVSLLSPQNTPDATGAHVWSSGPEDIGPRSW